MSFWEQIVPALVESTKTIVTSTPSDLQCVKFSDRMNLDSVSAENIIIALATISGALLLCLLMFVFISCVINSRRSNSANIQSSKVV